MGANSSNQCVLNLWLNVGVPSAPCDVIGIELTWKDSEKLGKMQEAGPELIP